MAGKVLFIVVDQMRADCLNGALASSLELPNLRALMSESVTFNRHYTVTTPCGPARASLLTSLYAMNHRSIRNGTPLDARLPTLGTEMRKGGYEPMLFGYTDTSADPTGKHPDDPDLRNYEGLAPGFSEIVRLRFGDSSSWMADLKAKGYDLPGNYWAVYYPKSSSPGNAPEINDPAIYTAQDSDTAFLTDQTLKEMSVREDHDWFATVTYIRPHPPLVAPEPYNRMYQPSDVPPPARLNTFDQEKSSHPFMDAFFSEPSNNDLYMGFDGKQDQLDDETIAKLRAVYFGLTSEIDTHVGRLLDYLRESGQYDDTLIIFSRRPR